MIEKRLAENISRVHAKDLVDTYYGGVTIGGSQLSEAYLKRFSKVDFADAWECGMALRHWIESAGYDSNGKFQIVVSDHILS